MLGGQGSPYLPAKEWEGSFGYRYLESDRHFTGTHEDKERATEHSEVINKVHLMDFGLSYGFHERISGTFSLPVLIATRSSPLRNAAGDVVDRDTQRAEGIGDMSLLGNLWVLKPSANPNGNLQLGSGVKLPTGDTDIRHHVFIRQGSTFVDQERTVDQSITPGDGGFGWIVTANAFKLVLEDFYPVTLFAQGSYLFNPRDTNGVPTFRTLPGEEVMSVADQYLGRIGFALPLLRKVLPEGQGLSISLAGRIEGVPVHDLIGKSNGFRRPGYAISIEPGIVYSFGRNSVGVSVPVALYRDRLRSVADENAPRNPVTNEKRHGDAAFADWIFLFSFTHRFGAPAGTEAPAPAPTTGPATGAAPSL